MPEDIGTSVAATSNHNKPYHAKRPHRKSRTGCRNCKTRKVKCDEGRPTCHSCTVRNETCVYMVAVRRRTSPPPSSSSSSSTSTSGQELLVAPPFAVAHRECTPATVPLQPLFIPSGRDELDMRLLWFYTTATYASFSTSLTQRDVEVVLKVHVVQHAFANPFLMDCLLGLSAMHINHLGLRSMGVSRTHEIYYRAKAFETYRKAVEAADPAAYPALLAASLLLCGLSTHVFRGEEAKPLSILDWMLIWRGIGTIAELTESRFPEVARPRNGIAQLLNRPDVDSVASAQCVPSNLLFMVTSIRDDDPDFAFVQAYYKALQVLGSLYLELSNGISQMLLLRIATFFTFLPSPFIDAARQKRPRALIILAHYLVFAMFRFAACWWMDGISQREIPGICQFLGPDWDHWLRVPRAALLLDNYQDVARLLLDDPHWDMPTTLETESPTTQHESELVIRAVMENEAADHMEVRKQSKILFEIP
ncbi:uncharacterized protein B0T15DRAFT_242145 [Chaetomium strumarium]|uniref:Zn(2)-C6 fungal-type domain-containing protein n=1 Tax=Chaetomium strumarium TaxID=1170767 RepID=A0AAJ0GQU2_9PEZI|nr:hypothetical protein B0T15DRAFT_242145 [Chaetomium strumarium]